MPGRRSTGNGSLGQPGDAAGLPIDGSPADRGAQRRKLVRSFSVRDVSVGGGLMSGQPEIFQQSMQNGHSAAWDGSWEQAASHYQQAMEESPHNPLALTSLGLALFELSRYDEALVCYSRAATISPEDPLPFEKIAQISEILGKLDYVTKAGLQAEALYSRRGEAEKAIENLTRVTRV